MKKLAQMLALGAIVFGSAAAYAESGSEAESYSRIGLSYDMVTMSANSKQGKMFGVGKKPKRTGDFNGIGFSYMYGHRLTESVPLYLEAGLKLSADFFSDEYKNTEDQGTYINKQKFQLFTIGIPVNFGYRIAFNDEAYLQPYVGLNFKFNGMFRERRDYEFKASSEYADMGVEDREDEGEWGNWLSSDEEDGMGEYPANVFQMGWNVGVGFGYKAFYVSASYGTDFIPIYNQEIYDNKCKINTANFALTLGVTF